MAISKKDAENLITKIQDDFYKKWSAGDAKGLAAFYHPDAVLIERGKSVAYGLEEIEKKYVEALKTPMGFKLNFELTTPAADGEYIIHRGTFVFDAQPDKPALYAQIYKRSKDGQYLIIHDIFENP
uniref:SnoaL-like domain-containing protein n=1 Tax=Panagrolaimus superbus TaxID=310955 RepID=A0A914YST7_9BILA